MFATTTLAPFLLLALGVLLAGGGCGWVRDGAGRPRTVLLTGFDPFGGRDVNESWEAVKVLEGETVRGRRVEVARLPVVYDEMAGPLAAAIERTRPEVVISFGVGTEVVRVETVARNAYNPKLPLDNAGRPPPRAQIDPSGPATVPTSLPTDAILAALAREGVPARASDDAGGYLCNEGFYRLARTRGPAADGIRARGFVARAAGGGAEPGGGHVRPRDDPAGGAGGARGDARRARRARRAGRARRRGGGDAPVGCRP